MTGAFDDANLGVRPACGERLRGGWRTEQVVAALHDDAGDAGELSGVFEQLVWPHEAVIGEVMRFHERRRGQGVAGADRNEVKPRARGLDLREDAFGVIP